MTWQKYLFRIYYDGHNYNGFQRQKNGNTIENYVELAFIRSQLIRSFAHNSYQSVSRTDTGVSAIDNMFTMTCEKEPNLVRLNAFLPKNQSIKIWGYAPIPSEFKVRTPKYKIYAYFLRNQQFQSISKIERLNEFEGKHDFITFIKSDGAGQYSSESKILKISIKQLKDGYFIIIKGDKFGREQIRRMLGFIMDQNFVNTDIKTVLHNKPQLHIRPVPAESLILLKIIYDKNINWITSSIEELLGYHHKILLEYIL